MLPQKQAARYRAASRRLAKLKAAGWTLATHPDVEILESELEELGARFVASLSPKTDSI